MNRLILVKDATNDENFGVLVCDGERTKALGFSEKSLDWQEWVNVNQVSKTDVLTSMPSHLIIGPETPINSKHLQSLETQIESKHFTRVIDEVGDGNLEQIEATRGFGRRYAVKNIHEKPSSTVSDSVIKTLDDDARQYLIEYKGLAARTDIQYSEITFVFKGARALWDPNIGPKGGWRCPPGTEYGGYITDRFGRGCGIGIIRRVGRALVNAGRGVDRVGERLDRRGAARDAGRLARAAERAQTGGRARERVARALEGGAQRILREDANVAGGRRARRNIPSEQVSPERIGEINDRLQQIAAELDSLVDEPPSSAIDSRIEELQEETARLRQERDGGLAPIRRASQPPAPTRRRVVAPSAERQTRQRAKKPVRRAITEGRREGVIERAARRIVGRERPRQERENRYSRVTDDALRRALYDNAPTPLVDGVDPESERQKTEERAEILREMARRNIDIPQEYTDEAIAAGVPQKRKRRRAERPDGENRRDAAARALERAARRVIGQEEKPRLSRVEELQDRIAELEKLIEENEAIAIQAPKVVRDWRRLQTELKQRRRQLERAIRQDDSESEAVGDDEDNAVPDVNLPESTPGEAPQTESTPSRRPSRPVSAPVPDTEEISDEELVTVQNDIDASTDEMMPTSASMRNVRNRFPRKLLPLTSWWRDEDVAARFNVDGEELERRFGKYYDDRDQLTERGKRLNEALRKERESAAVPDVAPARASARQRTRDSAASLRSTPAVRPSSEVAQRADDTPFVLSDLSRDEMDAITAAQLQIRADLVNNFARRMGLDPLDVMPGKIGLWIHKQPFSAQQLLFPLLEDLDVLNPQKPEFALQYARRPLRDRILNIAGIRGRYEGTERRLVNSLPERWKERTIRGSKFVFKDKFVGSPTREDAVARAQSNVRLLNEDHVVFALESSDYDGNIERTWHFGRYQDLMDFADDINDDEILRDVIGDVVVYRKQDTEDLANGRSLTEMGDGADSPSTPEEDTYRALRARNLMRPDVNLGFAWSPSFRQEARDINNDRLISELTDEELQEHSELLARLIAMRSRDAEIADALGVGIRTGRALMRDDQLTGALGDWDMGRLQSLYRKEIELREQAAGFFDYYNSENLVFDTQDEALNAVSALFDQDKQKYRVWFDKTSGKYIIAPDTSFFLPVDRMRLKQIETLVEYGLVDEVGLFPSLRTPTYSSNNNLEKALKFVDPAKLISSNKPFLNGVSAERERQYYFFLQDIAEAAFDKANPEAVMFMRRLMLPDDASPEDENAFRLFAERTLDQRKPTLNVLAKHIVDIEDIQQALKNRRNDRGVSASPSEILNARRQRNDLLEELGLLDSSVRVGELQRVRLNAMRQYLMAAGLFDIDGERGDISANGPDRVGGPKSTVRWIDSSLERQLRQNFDYAALEDIVRGYNETFADELMVMGSSLKKLQSERDRRAQILAHHRVNALKDSAFMSFRARQLRLAEATEQQLQKLDELISDLQARDSVDSPIVPPLESGFQYSSFAQDLDVSIISEFDDMADKLKNQTFWRDRLMFRVRAVEEAPDVDINREDYGDNLIEYAKARGRIPGLESADEAAVVAVEKAFQKKHEAFAYLREARKRGLRVRPTEASRINSDDALSDFVFSLVPDDDDVMFMGNEDFSKRGEIPKPKTQADFAHLLAEKELLRDALIVAAQNYSSSRFNTRERRDLKLGIYALLNDYMEVSTVLDDSKNSKPASEASRALSREVRQQGTLARLRQATEFQEAIDDYERHVARFVPERMRAIIRPNAPSMGQDMRNAMHRYIIKRDAIDRQIADQMRIANDSDYDESDRARALGTIETLHRDKAALNGALVDYFSAQENMFDSSEQRVLSDATLKFGSDYNNAAAEVDNQLRTRFDRSWTTLLRENRPGQLDDLIQRADFDISEDYGRARKILSNLSNRELTDDERQELSQIMGRLDRTMEVRQRAFERRQELDGGIFDKAWVPTRDDEDFLPPDLRPPMGPRRLGREDLNNLQAAKRHLDDGGDIADIPDGIVIQAVFADAKYIMDPNGGGYSTSDLDKDSDGNLRDYENKRIDGPVDFSEMKYKGLDGFAENKRFFFEVLEDKREADDPSYDYEPRALWQVIRVTDKETGDIWFAKASVLGHNDAMLEMLASQVAEQLEIGLRPEHIRVGEPHDVLDAYNWQDGSSVPDSPAERGRWMLIKHVGQVDYGPKANPDTIALDAWKEVQWQNIPNEDIEWRDLARIVAMDIAINNEDRHGGNLMVARDADGKARFVPIDHGLAGGARGRPEGESAADYLDNDTNNPLALLKAYNHIFGLARIKDWRFPSEVAEQQFEEQLRLSFQRLLDRLEIIFDVDRMQANGIRLTPQEIDHMLAIKAVAERRLTNMLDTELFIRQIVDFFKR